MSIPQETYLTGQNIDFIEAQYQRWLDDPKSVDPSWAELFVANGGRGKPLVIDGLQLKPAKKNGANGNGHAAPISAQGLATAAVASQSIDLQSKIDQTIFSFRLRGHLLTQLDPLGTPRAMLDHVADLGMVSPAHFSEAELDTLVDSQGAFDEPRVTVRRVLERMRRTYSDHIGVEYINMLNSERRRWLMRRMEHSENRTDFTVDEQKRILTRLTLAETFETTIHTKEKVAKRFSVEGGESMLPMLEAMLEVGGALGIREIVIGMAHRGRLNVLANICRKPADEIFSEFQGPTDPTKYLNRGDVKYHMGYSSDWQTRGGQNIHLTVAFNPSHLGVVHPVVEGRVRAKQDRVGKNGKHAITPLVIHGDAAFAGQGLVAETLNLGGLPGYDTGGTIHLVINNQLGYTTEAEQGRTPLYCTGMAAMLDIPIFHVNGDDAEACVHVMQLATEYRQRFHTDVVIDLVCFRKYGHNEGDEPSFTQPTMYKMIRAHPTVRQLYSAQLAKDGRVTLEESAEILKKCLDEFSEAHARSKTENKVKDPSHNLGIWARYKGGADAEVPQVPTGLEEPKLKGLLEKLAQTPEGFVLHPNVQKGVIDKRKKMVIGEEPLNWGAGEMLAYATLVSEGYALRVTGQDTERGTFAHRHAVLHDTLTGQSAFPLGALSPAQGRTVVLNSPLSEMACMGFEFGYSLDYPDALVVWEAQFGDFANNAQVMIDQFIAACEDKWKRLSGLTLLLPHGYEGQGPEHSTARMERFLELAAEDNLQVCYPTNAAQIFHLLRRQVERPIRKPLIVMTPKSLLRLEEACSPWIDFTRGTYLRVIGETNAAIDPAKANRLLLCSGKVYFDLVKARDAAKATDIAIIRLEQLYPLPVPELTEVLRSMPKVNDVRWVQEEPRNAGAWHSLIEPLTRLVESTHPKAKLAYVGRVESASPATGYIKAHEYEQKLLVEEALAKS
jgi:2-oxoglutarate dehydrogenase E1 component